MITSLQVPVYAHRILQVVHVSQAFTALLVPRSQFHAKVGITVKGKGITTIQALAILDTIALTDLGRQSQQME